MKTLFTLTPFVIGIFLTSAPVFASERLDLDTDIGNWKKIILLNRIDQGRTKFASFRVPKEFDVSESAKKVVNGEAAYLLEYTGDVDFIVGSNMCVVGQKSPEDIRCPIITIVYSPKGSFDPKTWKNGSMPLRYQSVDNYIQYEKDSADEDKERIIDFAPFKHQKYRAQSIVHMSRMAKGLFGQPLTMEVTLFSKRDKLDKVLTLGYLEQNWEKKEKIFESKSDWLYEEIFEKILSTVEFYK